MNTSASVLPQVNGVVLAYPNEGLTTEALRQRACAELLRQAAIQAGPFADTTRPSAAATPWVNVHSCATCCLPSRRAWM